MFLSPETFGSGCVVSRRSSQHLDECVCFLLLPVAMLLPLTTVLALYSMHSYFFGASHYCGCRHSWPATPCHGFWWLIAVVTHTHTLSHFRCYAVVPLNHMMLLSDLAKSGVHPFSTFQVVHFRFRIFQTTFALSCFIPSRVASDWLRGPLVSNSISHFFSDGLWSKAFMLWTVFIVVCALPTKICSLISSAWHCDPLKPNEKQCIDAVINFLLISDKYAFQIFE